MGLKICPCGEVWGMDELKAERRFQEFETGLSALGDEINETGRLGALIRDIVRNAFLAGYKVGHVEGAAFETTRTSETEIGSEQKQ